MSGTSPYAGLSPIQWADKTRELIDAHPLGDDEIVEVTLGAWEAIFTSKIGGKGFQIGKHLYPKPQIMGFFLHELIPLEFSSRYPNDWRGELTAADKDLVHIPDDKFSVEIKTSSHKSQIFGNRSYAQKGNTHKKSKSGYYLAVNFGKFSGKGSAQPAIHRIRFGWLDDTDWTGQTAATGQQARLSSDVEQGKLLRLYGG